MASLPAVQENQVIAGSSSPPPEPVGVRDLALIVLRRRSLILGCLLGGLLLGVIAVLLTKRMYEAQATIQLLKQASTGSLSTSAPSDAVSSDALDFNLTLQTQVDVLKSDAIALAVIQDLDLERKDPDFAFHSIRTPLTVQESKEPLASSPRRVANVLRIFKKHLHVDAVGGTRLITVGFDDSSPETAARVVNAVVEQFADYNFTLRFKATSQATNWLEAKLRRMKSEMEQSREGVAALQRQSGIYGPDETHNVITARLEQLNTELVNAEAVLVVKESVARAAASGNPDLVAGLVDTGTNSGGLNPTLTLLQNLRQQESEAEANLSSLTSKFGASYPRVIEARTRLESIQRATAAENTKMRYRAQAEYQIAKRVRDAAQSALEEQKREASALNDRSIDYELAKRDADAKDALYQQLTTRLTEAQVFSGLHASEVNVVDPALVPDKAAKPIVPLYVAGGTIGGAVLGLLLAFLLDALDQTLRDPAEVERATGMSLLGFVPSGLLRGAVAAPDRAKPIVGPTRFYQATALDPESRIGESFRSIRTSVLRSSSSAHRQVIAVTSPSAGDGKAFTAMNLATVLAQAGRRVLLVDADTRRGKITEYLGLSDAQEGVSTIMNRGKTAEYLGRKDGHDAGGLILSTGHQRTSAKSSPVLPDAFVLPRGPRRVDSAELASSAEMSALIDQARAEYDYIVINTPPLLPVVDALAISRIADLTIVVLRYGKTTKAALNQTLRLLSSSPHGEVGFVLNDMDPKGPDFTGRAGEKAYGYEDA